MSDPLRVGLVAEGPTDRLVVEAAVTAILGDRPFILRRLPPEESLPFEPAPSTGKGWGGVYLWCRTACQRSGGRLGEDALFEEYDLLILHLDADVASRKYSDYELPDEAGDLPCEEPCPPSRATTDRLRQVLLRWIGEPETPPRIVVCTPSKSTETWVVAALFPGDTVMNRKGWECHANPESRLAVQPKERRIKKSVRDFRALVPRLRSEWTRLEGELSEAKRFSDAMRTAIRDRDESGSLG